MVIFADKDGQIGELYAPSALPTGARPPFALFMSREVFSEVQRSADATVPTGGAAQHHPGRATRRTRGVGSLLSSHALLAGWRLEVTTAPR